MTRSKTFTVLVLAALLLVSAASAARAAQDTGTWSGTIAAVSGDDLALSGVPAHFRLAGGVTERLSGRPLNAANLAPGTSVTLRAGQREADGRFQASQVVVEPKNPLTITGTVNRVADDRRHVEVHNVEIEIDDHTGFSGRGASGQIRSARDLRVGATVSAALVPTTAGTLRATQVQAASAASEPGEDRELKGVVMAITDTAWTIDTGVFGITDQTVFEGEPGLGDFVEVRFHTGDAGALIADRIAKEDGAPGTEVEFMGIVEAIGASSWTISGRVVAVDSSTQILGNPKMGDTVEVEAQKVSDGSLIARQIKLEDTSDDEAEFRGTVESIGGGSWRIAGQTVLIDASTSILGNPAVGDTVEVKARRAPDGTLTATRIFKEDSSSVDPGDDNGNDHSNDSGNDDSGDDQSNSGRRGNDDHGSH